MKLIGFNRFSSTKVKFQDDYKKEKFEEYKKLLIHENSNVFQITKNGLIKIIAGNEEDIKNFCLLHHIDFQK